MLAGANALSPSDSFDSSDSRRDPSDVSIEMLDDATLIFRLASLSVADASPSAESLIHTALGLWKGE